MIDYIAKKTTKYILKLATYQYRLYAMAYLKYRVQGEKGNAPLGIGIPEGVRKSIESDINELIMAQRIYASLEELWVKE